MVPLLLSTPQPIMKISFRAQLLSSLTIFLLVGCQLFINAEEATPTPSTEIRLLGWKSTAAQDARFVQTLAQITSINSTITVTSELVSNFEDELITALESDFPPDIIFVESGRLVDLATAGLLRPIGEKIDASADFYPVLRQAFTYRGIFYCPPREFSTLAIAYNAEMLDDAAIPRPNNDWTWADFSSAIQRLTNPNTAVVGLALGNDLSRWLPFLYAAGGSLTDSNETRITINSPEAAAGFHVLDDLWTDFYAMKPGDLRTSWAGEALGKGRVAMAIEGDWIVPYLQSEYPEIELGIVTLPSGPQGKSTIAFSSCLAIPANAPHPDEALWIINQLVSADAMRAIYIDSSPLPARISVASQWQTKFPQMQPFLDGVEYAQPWRFFPGFGALKNNMEGNLQRMYKAEIRVEELLSAAEEAGNAALTR